MKLVIIRHPETNANAGLPGEPEAPSPLGQEQLSRVTEVCRSEAVQAVVHSTHARAVIAAQALAHALDIPAVAQEGLQERHFGDWDDWEWPRIAAQLDKLTIEERYVFAPPHGESWQHMEKRLHTALAHITALGYESVAIMTHWGPIRALLPLIRGEPKESTLQLAVANGQVFIEDYPPSAI